MLTNIVYENQIVTAFALLTFSLSSATVFIIVIAEGLSRKRSYWLLSYLMACLLVMMWFTVGFAAILWGVAIDTETYFRPMIPVLSTLFTGSLVFVYRSKMCAETIEHLKSVIIELKRSINESPVNKND